MSRIPVSAVLVAALGLYVAPPAFGTPFFTETVQSGGFVGTQLSVAVDDEGEPHVVYWDVTNFFLMYAHRTGGAWTTDIITAAVFLGEETDIAVDASGMPHVVYHEYTGVGGRLRYAVYDGASWSFETIDDTVVNVGRYCSLALDRQGRAHVSYHDGSNGDLEYALRDGIWTRGPVAQAGTTGLHTSLALDGSGRPHIAYTDDNNELYYALKVGSTWTTENVPGATDVTPTDIAVTSQGVPVVAHRISGFLQVITRDETLGVGQWKLLGGVPVGDGLTFDGGLVLGADGAPRVVYRKTTFDDLWYAALVGGVWQREAVAVTGAVQVGAYADLALDPWGNPVAAYSDDTHGDAMLADAGIRLASNLTASTWPVGAKRTISWSGAGSIEVQLSVDGGATYDVLAAGLTGGGDAAAGTYTFTVPHRPSRFCKLRIERQTPLARDTSDSLFTIESSVSLLAFAAQPQEQGVLLSWRTQPGPEDLAGYRLERENQSGRTILVSLTRETAFLDAEGGPGSEYRLFAVNGLGAAQLLGEAAMSPRSSLVAWPLPVRTGALTVSFATGAGPGGTPAPAEVVLYDVAGRLVRRVAQGDYAAGFQRATWDGRDTTGRLVPAGVYFLVSRSAGTEQRLKVVVAR